MIKNRFKKILLPLDGSLNSIRGLNEAISLARQTEAKITGIHIIPRFLRFEAQKTKYYRAQLARDAKRYLDKARTSAARNGVDFIDKVATSRDKVQTIVGFAKKNKFDIIVIGSRGLGSPKADYLGSVAHGIVNSSRIPVLVVK